LAWYFRGYCINRPASTGLFLVKYFVWRFSIFDYRGHLQALKVHDLKFYVWVNCAVKKTGKSKSYFKMKNMIGDGMNFRKYQFAIWRSIQNFYSHLTKVSECFSRIVEPWEACFLPVRKLIQISYIFSNNCQYIYCRARN
jgi:hypothetical protein